MDRGSNKLFQNKYRIDSCRIKNYDYSSPGFYFITICTQYRQHYFGRVEDGMMMLSEMGIVADQCMKAIPIHFPCANIDEYIIMPNHVHMIIEIIDSKKNNDSQNFAGFNKNNGSKEIDGLKEMIGGETQNFAGFNKNNGSKEIDGLKEMIGGETQNFASVSIDEGINSSIDASNHQKSKKIGSIVRGYKVGVKKYATINGVEFAWQRNYHDHVIVDSVAYQRIKKYIQQNPMKW